MSRKKDAGRCPLCDKHCPIKSPRCRKGEKYARSLQKENTALPEPVSPSIEDALLMQLRLLSRSLQRQNPQGSSRCRILSLLAQRERVGQQELKDLLGVKSGSLSELLAKLEKKGLIRRKKNEIDKRNRDIVLTEDGRVWLRAHEPECAGTNQLFATLSEDEKTQLTALLNRLLAADTQNLLKSELEPQPTDETESGCEMQPEVDASETEEDALFGENPAQKVKQP